MTEFAQKTFKSRQDDDQTMQRRDSAVLSDNRPLSFQQPVQKKANKTGLPDNLKSGMEALSGYNLDHVKVHYNSSKPAAVQAHAYARGNDIHLASGQEKYLPHELGHVIQQMQGRVRPTTSFGGVAVNDNPGLEREADLMGERALQMPISYKDNNTRGSGFSVSQVHDYTNNRQMYDQVTQRLIFVQHKNGIYIQNRKIEDNDENNKLVNLIIDRAKIKNPSNFKVMMKDSEVRVFSSVEELIGVLALYESIFQDIENTLDDKLVKSLRVGGAKISIGKLQKESLNRLAMGEIGHDVSELIPVPDVLYLDKAVHGIVAFLVSLGLRMPVEKIIKEPDKMVTDSREKFKSIRYGDDSWYKTVTEGVRGYLGHLGHGDARTVARVLGIITGFLVSFGIAPYGAIASGVAGKLNTVLFEALGYIVSKSEVESSNPEDLSVNKVMGRNVFTVIVSLNILKDKIMEMEEYKLPGSDDLIKSIEEIKDYLISYTDLIKNKGYQIRDESSKINPHPGDFSDSVESKIWKLKDNRREVETLFNE